MANIQDVDLEAITILLSTNNIEIPEKRSEIYDKAFSLMNKKSTSYEKVPISVIEWMLAYNALKNNLIDKSYHIRDLRKSSKTDQNALAKRLGMKGNNIENIINILRYMHKLEGELKFEENLDLYKPLILNSELSTVIDLLKSKRSLRPLVLELLPEIIKKDYDIYGFLDHDSAYNFIGKLIDTKDANLVKKAINVYHDLDEEFDPYYVLISHFFENKQLGLLFEILPKNYDINVLEEAIDSLLKSELTAEEYYYLIHESLKYAIRVKSKQLFEYMGYVWEDLTPEELTEEQKEKNKFFI